MKSPRRARKLATDALVIGQREVRQDSRFCLIAMGNLQHGNNARNVDDESPTSTRAAQDCVCNGLLSTVNFRVAPLPTRRTCESAGCTNAGYALCQDSKDLRVLLHTSAVDLRRIERQWATLRNVRQHLGSMGNRIKIWAIYGIETQRNR